jgi:hypothetical protein
VIGVEPLLDDARRDLRRLPAERRLQGLEVDGGQRARPYEGLDLLDDRRREGRVEPFFRPPPRPWS